MDLQEITYLRESWPLAEQVGYHGPGWYYWDYASCCYGPFETRMECLTAFERAITEDRL